MNPRGAFYTPYSLSRGAPSATWVLLRMKLAERVGFEPTDAFTSPVFKTGAFDHSAISPCVKAFPSPDAFYIVAHPYKDVNRNSTEKNQKNQKWGLKNIKGCGIVTKLI